ncbi:MAG: glycosyltransferase [Lactobacillales bacterium]|jgi:glycosyltransferase involved in cell wall biosynthesis|nr:glycosyltransferase [Lactobacillales bacterium]
MKILLINVVCKMGSTGKIVYDLYTELNKNGHEAAICYSRGSKIKERNIFKFSSNWEVYLHAILTRITGLHGCYSYFATKKLIKFIKKFQPDVINLHQFYAYSINEITLFRHLKDNNIKTVFTLHSEQHYTGKCGNSLDCDRWMRECGNCPYKKKWPKSCFFDFTKHMFLRKKEAMIGFENIIIVTPSQWLANKVKLSFLKDKKIKVVPNGIDVDAFCHSNVNKLRNSLKIHKDEKLLLFVSSDGLLDNYKGGRYIIELARKIENEDIRIIVVGKKANITDLPMNIIQIGEIYDKDLLAQYYSMADIMVITSKCENFPTVCLESLACGTPIVGFAEGGTAETAPGYYGLFVRYGDTQMLRRKILNYFNGDIKLKSKKECEDFAKQKYSKEKMFKEYMRLYQSS